MKFVDSFIARFSGYPASLEATLNSFVPHKIDLCASTCIHYLAHLASNCDTADAHKSILKAYT